MNARLYKRINLCVRGQMYDGRLPPRGFTLLEMLVALTVFGVALAGLFPLLANYSQQVQRLEKCSPQCGRWSSTINSAGHSVWTFRTRDVTFDYTQLPSAAERPNGTKKTDNNWYAYPDRWNLVPADDPWMWRLGAAATLVPDDPTKLTSDTTAMATHVPYLRPFPFNDMARLIADDSNPSTTSTSAGNHGYGTCSDAVASKDWSSWMQVSSGYQGECRRHASDPSGAAAATWVFTNVQPGWYEVWATWPDPTTGPFPLTGDGTQETSGTQAATYQLYDGTYDETKPSTWIPKATPPSVDQHVTLAVSGQDDSVANGFSDDANTVWKRIINKVYLGKQGTDPQHTSVPTDWGDVTDANNHTTHNAYKGDTITMKLLLPASGVPTSGFITADGVRLVAKPNKIVISTPPAAISTPLTWTWSHDSGTNKINQTVTATVTVTQQ